MVTAHYTVHARESVLLVALIALSWGAHVVVAAETVISVGEPGKEVRGIGDVSGWPPEVFAKSRLIEEDERRITIREANLFHRHFIDTCMTVLPREVTFGNDGLLATDNGRHSLNPRPRGQIYIANPLSSGAADADQLGIFGFWISTRQTTQTIAHCVLEGRQLFLNVDYVKDGRSVDDKLPALGGQSDARGARASREAALHESPQGTKPR